MAADSEFRIALVIPRSGSAGLYGPSCKSCAELAMHEINLAGGIDERHVSFVLIDGSQRPIAVAEAIRTLLDAASLSAIIGMHDSDVRTAIIEEVKGRVPYIYAANYEGDGVADGVINIGLTAAQQIRESVKWLAEHRSVKQWFFIGNDYIWPRSVERELARAIEDSGLSLIASEFVALGESNYSSYLNVIEQCGPDAVFAALVGADAIAFSRQFARRGLDKGICRFMPLFEENSLFAVANSLGQGIFTAGTYFAGSENNAEAAFKDRYEQYFGAEGPQLNGFGVACYEATTLLRALFEAIGGRLPTVMSVDAEELTFPWVHGRGRIRNRHAIRDVLLAEAVGSRFEIRARFEDVLSNGHLEQNAS